MTATSNEPHRPGPPQNENAGLKFVIELAPLLVFFAAYMKYGLKPATGALMVASLLAVVVSWQFLGGVPKALQISTALVWAFGGLTFLLDDPRFIMRKPTAVYLLFAAALGFGLATGRNFLKSMLGQAFQLNSEGWRKLTWRWLAFFVGMAGVNELLIQSVSEADWVKFKTFGFLGLTLIFGISQIGLIKRHSARDGSAT